MHYQIVTSVRLARPLEIVGDVDDSVATGFVFTIGVNTDNITHAVQLAVDIAQNPDAEDPIHVDRVKEMEIKEIEANQWPPDVLEQIEDLGKMGVYFRSALAFYSDE